MAASKDDGVRISACASPISLGGLERDVDTIAAVVTVTVKGGVAAKDVEIDAPRGAILERQAFSLRFLSREGPRRALFRCIDAVPQPRMRDRVRAARLTDPVPAPERAAYREPINLRLRGRVQRSAKLREGYALSVEVVDASEGGVCLDTAASLAAGDAVWVAAPPNPGVEGASIEIVRRDAGSPSRYGGRFEPPEGGLPMFGALVAAARERRAQTPVERAPLPSPGAVPPLQEPRDGMYTRRLRRR